MPLPPPPVKRPPRPPKPLPNLTTEKKTGKAALNTFAELAAFFKTQDEPEKPKAEQAPKVEEVTPEAPKPEETKVEVPKPEEPLTPS